MTAQNPEDRLCLAEKLALERDNPWDSLEPPGSDDGWHYCWNAVDGRHCEWCDGPR